MTARHPSPLLRRCAAAMLLTALLAAYALAAYARTPSATPSATPSDADRRKADYIFMEANRQHALESEDAYYELLRRACQLNPDDHHAGHYLGCYTAMLAGDDSARFEQGYAMMKRHFDLAPEDYYPSFTYGIINDRVGREQEALRVWSALDSLYPNKVDVALRLAETLFHTLDTANVERTLAVYNRIERAQGRSIPLATRKIRVHLLTSDTVSALGEVRSLLTSSPTNSDYHVFAGDVFSLFARRDSALAHYDRACLLDPTSGRAYYSRANFYKSAGDSAAYDREVFQALMMESLDLPTKLEIMTNYVRDLYEDPAQQPRIQQLFASLLEQHPHEVEVHDLYYSYLIAINDYAAAAEQVGYVLDIDPSDERKWRALVSLCMQLNDYDGAIDAATRALAYHARSGNLALLRAISHSQKKDYDDAIADYGLAIELADSGNVEFASEVLCSMADTYAAADRRADAEDCYRQAIGLNPDNMLALNNYAYMLAVDGRDLDHAERMSARTVKERPDDISALDTYAWILYRQKRFTEALVYMKKALDLMETPSDELLAHAGDIYFWNGDHEKAVDYWRQALDLNPDDELLARKVRHKTFFFE